MTALRQRKIGQAETERTDAFYSGARSDIARRIARAPDEKKKYFRAIAVISGGFYDKVARSMGLDILEGLLTVFTGRLARALPINSPVANVYGDQFVCLIEAPSRTQLESQISGGLKTLSESFTIGGTDLAIDVTIGLAEIVNGSTDIDELIRKAFIAADQANTERRQWAFHDPVSDKQQNDDLSVLAAVRSGLDKKEFFLHYQPKLNLANQCIEGVEALARWNCPARGAMSPAIWIPVIEKSSLINQFTDFVLSEAVEQLGGWERNGIKIPIAINVSVNDLLDSNRQTGLVACLERLEPLLPYIEIEVTETAVVNNFKIVADTLRTLRSLGVKISIDDFGTGYSSLVYLREVPADNVKIDQLFIRSVAKNDVDFRIVNASIQLAHGLGMKVIAEGVEDEQTLAILRDAGCDFAQGYHISRPISADEIATKFFASPSPRRSDTH